VDIELIWVFGKPEYFCKRDWTQERHRPLLICPTGKISSALLQLPLPSAASAGEVDALAGARLAPAWARIKRGLAVELASSVHDEGPLADRPCRRHRNDRCAVAFASESQKRRRPVPLRR
jgi:hypothetical protein